MTQMLDPESKVFFDRMAEQDRVRSNRIHGVKTVLVILSSKAIVFDIESLKQKIMHAYPESAIFFRTTLGKPVGPVSPERVDLLIDFTGPRQRQPFFYSRKLRAMSRVAIGRNAGLFRKRLYDRVLDENTMELPKELLSRERAVQRKVLELAGVALVQSGESAPDRGKITPLELPPLARS